MSLKNLRFRLSLALAISAGPGLFAEAPAPAPAAGAAAAAPPAPAGQAPQQGSRVQVFDDRIFNLESTAPPPRAVSPGGRYLGDAPNYNSEQQREWKTACAAVRNDVRAYRRCYQEQKLRSEAAVRESFERVERNQMGTRLRGGMRPPSPLDYETPDRVPSSEAREELERAIEMDKDSD